MGIISCAYGAVTDRDLSKPLDILACCALALLVVSLINVFVFKNNFLEIGISAFVIIFHAAFLAYNSSEMNKVMNNYGENIIDDRQFVNCYSMRVTNSVVGVTLELLNITKNAQEISSRE